MTVRILVLGAAAGGGSPQWNSNGAGCKRARARDPAIPARSQASIAVSVDDANWFLLNASPDIREQIIRTPALHPRQGLRDSPIAGVVLAGGDVDAIAGLLTLRERQAFTVYATPTVHGILEANSIFEVLARDTVKRQRVELDQATPLNLPNGQPAGLDITLFGVPGKVPLYLEQGADAPPIGVGESNVGVEIRTDGPPIFFIPGCAAMTPELAARVRGATLVFFDGTLWRDDEMVTGGLGEKTGQRMGHMSLNGDNGTLAAFRNLDVQRKILIHINNSNPVLMADTRERAYTENAGWEVSYDGMEIHC